MVNLSEKETRERYIDPLLKNEGWDERYIKKEVNTLKSNFKVKKFKYRSDTLEGEKSRFADYLLVGEDYSPLAIIEAKRFSIDPEKGIIQATTYQKDIGSQTGYSVPIFLTNGKKWYIKEKGYPKRRVSGPFSQTDLKRKLDLSRNKIDLRTIEINEKIVDRSKSIQIVKEVLEHFQAGNRSALINMATGTGKTRVSMAIIEAMIKARFVQNVLFVVDRISLGRQAYGSGFQKFLSSEPSCLLNEHEFTKDKRLYVSTVQTLMAKQGGEHIFQKFSPGFFDLIIYDEAHRSYYDKQNLVMKYFDALKIGLTATPSKREDKNTYDLFECGRGKPTVEYTYQEAVNDKVLVLYDAQIIETKVMALGIKGMELNKDLKTQLIKQEEDPEHFQVPGTKFAKYFTDEKTNELIVTEFMNRCYTTEDGKPCKTIFFCINVKHAEALEKAFNKLYPNLADDVKVIVSKYDRYMDEVDRFIKESSPRIAISVGVLDTGVDIPEVMNLVFVTPVFSHIRFWQMVGRGTRSLSACTHKGWLPVRDGMHYKDDFRILDFKFGEWSNVKEHEFEVKEKTKSTEDIRVKIFNKEVELLKKKLSAGEKGILENQIIDRVKKIDQRSFIVRDKLPFIKKIISRKYDLEAHIKELKEEIAPLLKFSEFGDGRVQTFISHCVDLFRYVKEDDIEAIDKEKSFVQERLINLWEQDLEAVRKQQEEIKQVLQEKFWQELTFEDIDFLIREISPLMIYYQKERKKLIQIDDPDFILSIESHKMEIKENPEFEDFKKNPLVQKMIKEGVTWRELYQISDMLSKLDPSSTIEKVQRKQDFVLFLRNILDLTDLPDPEEMIKQEFEKLIIKENKNYTSEQIKFLRILSTFFALNKHLERKDFTKHPLSEENPLAKFSEEELDNIIRKVEKIKIR